MADWLAAVIAAEGAAALVTILATEGSAPRRAGTRMVVTADAAFGTIGGGALEWRVAEQARAILSLPPGSWRTQDYPLGPLLGQCCGGRVRVLVERIGETGWMARVAAGERVVTVLEEGRVRRFTAPCQGVSDREGHADRRSVPERRSVPGHLSTPERHAGTVPHAGTLRHPSEGWGLSEIPAPPIPGDPSLRWSDGEEEGQIPARGPTPSRFVEPLDTPRRPLMLFGAGHVGRAIARAVPGLPLDLAWFDSRAEADAPGVTIQDEAALVACAGEARAEATVLILTHDHALDYRLAAAALASPARFVGLIGSATKRARFVSRLAADGIDTDRLTCPIGAPGIAGKEPAVIAIAALAQLLALGAPA